MQEKSHNRLLVATHRGEKRKVGVGQSVARGPKPPVLAAQFHMTSASPNIVNKVNKSDTGQV